MLNGTAFNIAVIGAGPAGASAAIAAAALGLGVDWYDKEPRPGGKLNDYHELFPDRVLAEKVLEDFNGQMEAVVIRKHFGTVVTRLETDNRQLALISGNRIVGHADAVVLATGFDFFDARRKEELGYGLYKQVITSADLENIFKSDSAGLRVGGAEPLSVAFVHCVGSRDQQAGIDYCSRLCCMTGIRQAIRISELYPACKVVNFYIDIRAFGNGYEELYREAQEKHRVRFIRGRVSEASEDQQHRIVLKAEDTLMGRPLKLTVDWLVLLVGMVPSCTRVQPAETGSPDGGNGFYRPSNPLTGTALDGNPGIFIAGACGGPASIPEAIASGRSAALEAWQYLKKR